MSLQDYKQQTAVARPNMNWFYDEHSKFTIIGAIVLVSDPGNTILVDTRFLSKKCKTGRDNLRIVLCI